MIRARIIVEGVVQRVGYRDFVQEIARKLGVKGYVENLKDGNVQIVCEVEESVLQDFLVEIDVKEDFIRVDRVRVVERSEAIREFDYFEIKHGKLEEEFGERIGTAIKYAGGMRQDIREMHRDLKGDTVAIKEAIVDMHKDLKEDTTGIKEAVKGMHKDLKDAIGDMHRDLKEDALGIKGAIVEMHKDLKDEMVGVRSEVRDMHADMNESFKEMAERYDAISSELVRTREELTRAVNGLLKLIEEFIHERRGAGLTERKE